MQHRHDYGAGATVSNYICNMNNAHFIKKAKCTFKYSVGSPVEVHAVFDNEKRVFKDTEYLGYILDMYYGIIDEEKNPVKKYTKSIECKREIIHYRDEFNAMNKMDIDCNSILNRCDATIDMLRIKCENILLDRQIHIYKDPAFWKGCIVGAITAAISLLAIYFEYIK